MFSIYFYRFVFAVMSHTCVLSSAQLLNNYTSLFVGMWTVVIAFFFSVPRCMERTWVQFSCM